MGKSIGRHASITNEFPQKKIYQIYVQRINEFVEHPAPEDWDGIYGMLRNNIIGHDSAVTLNW